MALIRVVAGRALRWSPPWPCSDGRVLFDASSGDYWVLSTDGQAAVHALECEGPLDDGVLLARLGVDHAGDRARALALLHELARSGIITYPEAALADNPPAAEAPFA